jgi:cobalt-zinc-cadmium resistance protein CzcA
VNVVRLPSAALDFSKEQSSFLEQSLKQKFPEIDTVVSKSGRAQIAEDPMGPEQTDMFIMLHPYSQWRKGKTKQTLLEEIRSEMLQMPGIKPGFSQPIALRVNELISGVKSDVAIKIFGDDLGTLKNIAEKIAPVLGLVRGATDIKVEQVSGFSQIEVEMKRPEMARHKINANLVNLMVEAAIGGKVVTYFLEGEKRFAVLIRFPEKYRDSIYALERILVSSPLGYQMPMGKITTIREVEVPAQVSRENSQRRLLVECNIRHRDMGSFIAEAKRFLSSIEAELPIGYRIVWGGQFENQQRAMKKLSFAVPLAILIIAGMLYSAFRSLRSALMVLLNLPFAVIGGLWMVFIFQINISVSAVIGFIALLGMAVENGTVLVSFFEELRAQGLSIYDAVVEGTRLRMRSILATSLTTLFGLFPMLYATGPGSEIQRPLAIVIMGGLFSEVLLVLVVFPAVYLQLHRKS